VAGRFKELRLNRIYATDSLKIIICACYLLDAVTGNDYAVGLLQHLLQVKRLNQVCLESCKKSLAL
jgi:hypothetical protein